MSKMPAQKPHKSEQVVCTPKEFLDAVRRRLCIDNFVWDLAADHDNKVCDACYTEEDDALIQSWNVVPGWSFCNPPFEDLAPWTAKAAHEATRGAHVAMLTPASVGSEWFRAYVDRKAYVLFLSPRITFVGHKHCYPKDLILSLYTPEGCYGYECWRWKEKV